MEKLLVTGSAGLIGSEAIRFFAAKGFRVFGIDNNMRAYFFGAAASTKWNLERIKEEVPDYTHFNVDIRDRKSIAEIFQEHKFNFIIHAAAQPSHDWAAKEPFTDFGINAVGTLIMLENFRQYCPEATFIFTSTNKVYGDKPNEIPLIEHPTRFEPTEDHPYYRGIDETMSLDDSLHSIFGASKVAADIMVQEYGRYFNLHTGVFRGGCLTGPAHSGTQLHGFLAYLVKCIATGEKYSIFGYKGKQVRDNIHSFDLINAFYYFHQHPTCGEAYNMGGSRHSNISMTEAIAKTEAILGKKAKTEYVDKNRKGDHIWYISDVSKFQSHYPQWHYQYDIDRLLEEICRAGHFASVASGASTLTYLKNDSPEPQEKLGTVFLAGHVSGAHGPVQALRHHLDLGAQKVIAVEHSLAKTGRHPFMALKDIYLNLKWFWPNRQETKIFFGIDAINALSGWLAKKLGKKFTLIYYTVDYSPKRLANPVLNRVFHSIDRLCAKGADFVWSSSTEIQQLRRKQGINDGKNILVRSGVQKVRAMEDLSHSANGQRTTLVIDGFLSKEPLVELALKTMAKLKERQPTINLQIVPGEIPREKLETLANQLGIADRVTVHPNVPHSMAFFNYQNYGLALGLFQISATDPASYRDPVEIKEFLAAGLPVIASRGFGLSQEISEGMMGLEVDNNEEKLAHAIEAILTNDELYRQFSHNALQYAQNLSWQNIFTEALKKSGLDGSKK